MYHYNSLHIPMTRLVLDPITLLLKSPIKTVARDPPSLENTLCHKIYAHLQRWFASTFSLDWFKGKFTGNHGFYHQI